MKHFLNGIKEDGRLAYQEVIEKKKQWIEESQMVIIRSHDVMDIIRSKDYYNVYKIEPDAAWNVAQKIANSLMFLDQPGVAFYGDENRMVSSVGLGTGCICDPRQYLELGPELQITIDDAVRTWVLTTYAEDTGDPLVVKRV
ncbi:MAG: hypothetical protein ABFS28_10420 [Bacteroidota bacterium]